MSILDQIKQERFHDKADAYHYAFKLLNFSNNICVDVYNSREGSWYVSSMEQEIEGEKCNYEEKIEELKSEISTIYGILDNIRNIKHD